MKKSIVSIAIGSAFVASAALAPVANAADNPFAGAKLDSGYQLAQADTKAKDAKCGADKAKEGKCGGDKAKDAKCGADKAKEGKCGGDKAKDGKCGADKKKEGKCGEAKCGADKKK
jgi:uncharacterized low-complexity protein